MENKLIHCRSCLLPTETKPSLFRPYDFVTCLNPACKAHYFTFTSDSYHEVDLSQYNGAIEHPEYARFIALDMSVQMDVDSENVEVLHV